MFQRTRHFWQRLLGAGASGGAEGAVEDDRRKSVRHDTDREIVYRSTRDADRLHSRTARLCNVSTGGLRMIVGDVFKPGELISVEMPGDPARQVLACVVHVQSESDDSWSIGCTFSRDLSPADLRLFAGGATEDEDLRDRTRYDCRLQASWYLVVDGADSRERSADVLNVSTTGIGLLVNEPLAPGALLNVDLMGANDDDPRSLLTCVVHVTDREDGRWAVGCNFIEEISEERLDELVESPR